jgi:hypothetical protein
VDKQKLSQTYTVSFQVDGKLAYLLAGLTLVSTNGKADEVTSRLFQEVMAEYFAHAFNRFDRQELEKFPRESLDAVIKQLFKAKK